jgi:hypothetical protein
MIIKREAKPVLHRQKCKACDYYTFYRAVPAGDQAIDTCTSCGHQIEIAWNEEIKAIFKNNEKLLRDLESVYPELQKLKEPGNRIRLD